MSNPNDNDERPDDDEGESALDDIRENGITEGNLEKVLETGISFARWIRAAIKHQEDD